MAKRIPQATETPVPARREPPRPTWAPRDRHPAVGTGQHVGGPVVRVPPAPEELERWADD